jgi:hypothetical protein
MCHRLRIAGKLHAPRKLELVPMALRHSTLGFFFQTFHECRSTHREVSPFVYKIPLAQVNINASRFGLGLTQEQLEAIYRWKLFKRCLSKRNNMYDFVPSTYIQIECRSSLLWLKASFMKTVRAIAHRCKVVYNIYIYPEG